MSTSSISSLDDSTSSSSSSPATTDESTTALAFAASAVPHPNPPLTRKQKTGEALIGLDSKAVVESIVRTMVFPLPPTLSEEIQTRACADERAKPTRWRRLSELAKALIDGDCKLSYDVLSGLDWQNTSFQQRYAVTTPMPHDDALRLEFDRFSAWMNEMLSLTTSDVRSRDEFRWISQYLADADTDADLTEGGRFFSRPTRDTDSL